MAIQSFKKLVREVKTTNHYVVEAAKLDFVKGITRLLAKYSISQTALASKLESSPAYVTKALRGDANFTIETMVKLAQSVNGKLHIHVADQSCSVRWMEVFEKVNPQPKLESEQLLFWKSNSNQRLNKLDLQSGDRHVAA